MDVICVICKLCIILFAVSVNYLYMAPEILQMTDKLAIGTTGGDVYSFGIIMKDLALMAGPYSIEMAELSVEGRCMPQWVIVQ